MTNYAIIFTLAGYSLSAIPFGYLIGLIHGVTILEEGSGNIGATNLTRVLKQHGVSRAWIWGTMGLLLDIAKGALPVWLYLWYEPSQQWVVVVALATVSGHLWTPFLRFRGGRGVATSLGVIFSLNWVVALVCWAIALATRLAFRHNSERTAISSVVGIWSACTVFIVLAITDDFTNTTVRYLVIALILAILVSIKHRDNFARIKQSRTD